MKKTLLFVFSCLISLSSFAQRKVLFEVFSNASCGSCGTWGPQLNAIIDTCSLDIISLKFPTNFPSLDSMYYENQAENDARMEFYNISAVPWAQVNGSTPFGVGPLVMFWSSNVSSFDDVSSPTFSVSFDYAKYNGSFYKAKCNFTDQFGYTLADSLVGHIILMEDHVYKADYASTPGFNSETVYRHVVRNMLNGSQGSYLNNLGLGNLSSITSSDYTNNIKNQSEVRIVAYVQNRNTKEIYNAEVISPIYSLPDTVYIATDTTVGTSFYIHINSPSYTYDTIYVTSPQNNDTVLQSTLVDTTTNHTYGSLPTSNILIDPLTVSSQQHISQSNIFSINHHLNYLIHVYIDTTTIAINELSFESDSKKLLPYTSLDFYNIEGRKVCNLTIDKGSYTIPSWLDKGLYIAYCNNGKEQLAFRILVK